LSKNDIQSCSRRNADGYAVLEQHRKTTRSHPAGGARKLGADAWRAWNAGQCASSDEVGARLGDNGLPHDPNSGLDQDGLCLAGMQAHDCSALMQKIAGHLYHFQGAIIH
jgi:hypothetical protein